MSLQSLVDLRFVQNNSFHKTASCSNTVITLGLDVENKLLTNSRHENQDRDHLRAKNRKEKIDLDLVMLV